jgi:hypothetical protein
LPGRKRSYIMPVDEKTIGGRLRSLREERGLPQAEIAQAGSRSVAGLRLRAWRRKAPWPVAAFAKALKVSADAALGLDQSKAKPSGVVKDRRFARRLQLIDRLSRRQKDALLTTIDTFLKGAGLDPHQS